MKNILNFGCSCFSLTSKQRNKYWFRTCDMNDELNVWKAGSKVISLERNEKLEFLNKETYLNKYKIMGITFGDSKTKLLDGMNEKGLVGGLLFLLEGTSVDVNNESEVDNEYTQVEGMEFLVYVLSRCIDISEVLDIVKKVQISNVIYKDIQTPATMHYTFLDRSGNSLVLEATKNGKLDIYENTIGVMTNSPTYKEHMQNLEWFIANSLEFQNGREDIELPKISKLRFDGIEVNGNKNVKTYLRSNVFPGSYISYDRFVRLAVFKSLNDSGNYFEDEKMLLEGSKILNSVVVPKTKGYFYYNYLLKDKTHIQHSLDGNILYGGGNDYTQYEIMYDLSKLEMWLKKEDTLVWERIKMV